MSYYLGAFDIDQSLKSKIGCIIFFMHCTLIWLVSFESDLQDKKNGINYFFLPQKLTKLEQVSGFSITTISFMSDLSQKQ